MLWSDEMNAWGVKCMFRGPTEVTCWGRREFEDMSALWSDGRNGWKVKCMVRGREVWWKATR